MKCVREGRNKEDALDMMKDNLYYGNMMVKCGDADGLVAGALNTTGDVLRPAFKS